MTLMFTIAVVCLPTGSVFSVLSLAAEEPDEIETEAFIRRTKEVNVPVVMYHLVTDNSKYIGKYGVTPEELRQDLEYLKKKKYNTIVMQDLINYVERGDKLPKNPVMLTFDDGNFSDYCYLLPLLKEFNMKAVVAVIGSATDKYTALAEKTPKGRFPNLTWSQVIELHKSGLVEIQNHSYDLHGSGGSGRRKDESAETYHTRLFNDLKKFQDLCQTHLGYKPTTFVYPLGVISKGSREVLEELGMIASLSCQEGMNTIRQGDKDCLFQLQRTNRPSGNGIESILRSIK